MKYQICPGKHIENKKINDSVGFSKSSLLFSKISNLILLTIQTTCLERIELLNLLHVCAPYFELPSYIGTMLSFF